MPRRLLFVGQQGVFDCFDQIPMAAAHKSRVPWAPQWNIAQCQEMLDPNCHLVIAAHGGVAGVAIDPQGTPPGYINVTALAGRILQRITHRNRITRVTYLICHAGRNVQPSPDFAQYAPQSTLVYNALRLSVNFSRPNANPPVAGVATRPETVDAAITQEGALAGWNFVPRG